MKILLTNDDGILADGLTQLAGVLQSRGNSVFVVAPATEQSGVSSSITFLRPLFPKKVTVRAGDGEEVEGAVVDGTPVDCVRLGIFELCPWKPDVVVSGINDGLNAGTNVNYSGTVAGAMTAASLGYPAMAISLESSPEQKFSRAAESAWPIIQRLAEIDLVPGAFLNLNYPTSSIESEPCFDFEVVPTETNPMGYKYHQGGDPKNRPYYWASNDPPPEPSGFATDTQELLAGKVTLSVLSSNLNLHNGVVQLKEKFQPKESNS
jgi:5'-nucleotidase